MSVVPVTPPQVVEIASTTTKAVVEVVSASSTPEVVLNPVLARIALCESGNNPKAKNPGSSASGRFQFIRSSWNYYGKQLWGEKLAEKDVFSWDDNTELAIFVFNKNGTSDWLESKYCWDKKK